MSESDLITILVPMYNEEAVFNSFFDSIEPILQSANVNYEIICVDDGSKDSTAQLIKDKCESDSRVKGLILSRNFGKEAAMTAALDHAQGNAIIPIDADLQDPPELIPDMISKWKEGFHVVCAKRVSRDSDTPMKRNTAGLFYKVFNRLSEVPIPENVGDYRLMDRRVVDEVKKLPERERFMKGLFCWPGFSTTTIEYERQLRAEGETKFNYWKLWNFALDGITSFSTAPIRLGVYAGLGVSAIAFLYGLAIMLKTLFTGVDVPGYASLMVVVLFMGGIQLFFLGLLGEYVGRMYKEVKARPVYIIDTTVGLQSPQMKEQ